MSLDSEHPVLVLVVVVVVVALEDESKKDSGKEGED